MKITGIITFALGIMFIILESVFYGDVDANGVLQESLFLPLGILFTIIGSFLLAVHSINLLCHALKKTN